MGLPILFPVFPVLPAAVCRAPCLPPRGRPALAALVLAGAQLVLLSLPGG